jgi:hypothetical protein
MTKKQAETICRKVDAQRTEIIRADGTWAVSITTHGGTGLIRYDYDRAMEDLKERRMLEGR